MFVIISDITHVIVVIMPRLKTLEITGVRVVQAESVSEVEQVFARAVLLVVTLLVDV